MPPVTQTPEPERNPYAPPAQDDALAPLVPSESGRTVQLVLQLVLMAVHGIVLLATAFQLALDVAGVGPEPAVTHGSPAEAAGYQVGRALAVVLATLWSAGGAGWCGANIYGIWQHKGWAYRSLRAYWTVIILTLCCFPVGIGGLLHLRRPRVKLALDVPPAG